MQFPTVFLPSNTDDNRLADQGWDPMHIRIAEAMPWGSLEVEGLPFGLVTGETVLAWLSERDLYDIQEPPTPEDSKGEAAFPVHLYHFYNRFGASCETAKETTPSISVLILS